MNIPKLMGLHLRERDMETFESRTFPTLTSQRSQVLRRRLLLAYLAAMAAIIGTSIAGVYIFLNRNLNQEVNSELRTLAKSAVPVLETVKTREFQTLVEIVGPDLEAIQSHGLKSLDSNIPWHNSFQVEQSIEWFSADGELLAKEGTTFPKFPLAKDFSPSSRLNKSNPVIQQQGQLRTLTLSVYSDDPKQKTLQLEGYIRVSESTERVEEVLRESRWGLGLGGIAALILSGITGLCLSQWAVEPIKQSFQRLIQFTADASHELRNPLTAIGTTVEVMQSHSEQFNPSDAKKLEILSSATAQLTHLVEDLLFLARTDAAAFQSEVESERSLVPLDELLEDLVDRFELQAQSKGIHFESHLPSGISVKGDANQLLRLFSNLLENAFKYTEPGGRAILSLHRCKRFAIIRVEDTGRGIPSEYLPYIFQRFWRVDKA